MKPLNQILPTKTTTLLILLVGVIGVALYLVSYPFFALSRAEKKVATLAMNISATSGDQ